MNTFKMVIDLSTLLYEEFPTVVTSDDPLVFDMSEEL